MKIDRVKLAEEMARQNIRCGYLAEKANLCRLTITKARKGQQCEYESARKIAKALGIPVQDIIEDED